jgi:hypothetical protein
MQEQEVEPSRPDVSVSKPQARWLRLFPADRLVDGWDAPDRWLSRNSDLTVSLDLVLILICETVVFQVERVSVGSVRAFISYLEVVCSLPWGDVLTACLGSGRS